MSLSVFQIPMCVVTPCLGPMKSSSKLLQDFAACKLYFEGSDEEIDDYNIPIVIIYNCQSHFLGTTLLNNEEQQMFHAKLCLDHLSLAKDMFFNMDMAVISQPGLQEAMADLMHNVAAVQGMITSAIPSQGSLTIPHHSRRDEERTRHDEERTRRDEERTPRGDEMSQDSGEDILVDLEEVTPVMTSQGTQEAKVQQYEKKRRIKEKRKRKQAEKSKEMHKCPKPNCDKSFGRAADLKEHIKAQHGHRFRCAYCTQKFMHRRSMLRHQKEKHEEHDAEQDFRCGQKNCHFGDTTAHKIKRHMIKRHGTGFSQKCRYCQKKVSLLGTRKHDIVCNKRVDQKSRVIRCPGVLEDGTTCNKRFITAEGFKSHDDRVHKGTGGAPCHVCGKIMATKTTLSKHLETHRDDEELANEDAKNYTLVQEEEDEEEDIPSEEDETSGSDVSGVSDEN